MAVSGDRTARCEQPVTTPFSAILTAKTTIAEVPIFMLPVVFSRKRSKSCDSKKYPIYVNTIN
jgi:hypothetical protein